MKKEQFTPKIKLTCFNVGSNVEIIVKDKEIPPNCKYVLGHHHI